MLLPVRVPRRAAQRRTRLTPVRQLRVAGLFAGIGGIELGLQRAGHEGVLLCEAEGLFIAPREGADLAGIVASLTRKGTTDG